MIKVEIRRSDFFFLSLLFSSFVAVALRGLHYEHYLVFSSNFAILKLFTFSPNVANNVALCVLVLRTLKTSKNTFPILNVIRTQRKNKLCFVL